MATKCEARGHRFKVLHETKEMQLRKCKLCQQFFKVVDGALSEPDKSIKLNMIEEINGKRVWKVKTRQKSEAPKKEGKECCGSKGTRHKKGCPTKK